MVAWTPYAPTPRCRPSRPAGCEGRTGSGRGGAACSYRHRSPTDRAGLCRRRSSTGPTVRRARATRAAAVASHGCAHRSPWDGCCLDPVGRRWTRVCASNSLHIPRFEVHGGRASPSGARPSCWVELRRQDLSPPHGGCQTPLEPLSTPTLCRLTQFATLPLCRQELRTTETTQGGRE